MNMKVIADLQVHSKYARATSKDLSLENIEKYGRVKGLSLIGTGDFQHPEHYKDIQRCLKEDRNGILYSKSGFPFMWQTEVSLMFSQNGKRHAVHLLMYSPNGQTADKIIKYLSSKGRLDYDGRPIFGITCRDFVKDLGAIDERIEIISAHCMTPWFGIFGSSSGFDSIYECFGDQVDKVHAIESGMSADPSMLWRLKEKVNIVSFSDAHSFWPWRIGRESTIFDVEELSYDDIINAIRTGRGLSGTIETYPEYGKYHYDGHRNCKFSCAPEETKKLNGICPVCKKPMTIGVEYRIEQLAKEKPGYRPQDAKPFYKLLPLHEIIAFSLRSTLSSRKTWSIYNELVEKFGSEFNVLLNVPDSEIEDACAELGLADLIMLNRSGELRIRPGFDGEYGVIDASEMGHAAPAGMISGQRPLF